MNERWVSGAGFPDGDEIFIQSRDEKPLDTLLSELIEPLWRRCLTDCVLARKSSSPEWCAGIFDA